MSVVIRLQKKRRLRWHINFFV